jgi:ADP-ribose pyrophosphatase YjhB (NUDIX family)
MEDDKNFLIASGPVIIEDNKVLLVKEIKAEKITAWMFPGGTVEKIDQTLEEACAREVQEELGIKIQIIRALKPIMIRKNEQTIILIHYLADKDGEIKPGSEIKDWNWHDINNLPEDCAANVYEVIEDYKKTL